MTGCWSTSLTGRQVCAYVAQSDALHLKPWEFAPAWISDIATALREPDDARRVRSAALLLQRMLASGLSRFEPRPLDALNQAMRSTAP